MSGIGVLILFWVLACLPGCGQADAGAIHAVNADYEEALATANPDAALMHFSDESLAIYDRLLKVAHTGTRAEIMALPLGERWEILIMRTYLSDPKNPRPANGREYVRQAVRDRYWVSEDYPRVQLRELRISGSQAHADIKLGFLRTTVRRYFMKQGDAWKLDELRNFEELSSIVRQYGQENNLSDEAALLDLARDEDEPPADPKVWDTPLTKKK